MTIPDWTAAGILPPIDARDPVSNARSPYQATLSDVILRFGTSSERRKILRGWIDYRAELYAVGIESGFQWVDGSFLEDIEMLEKRPPRDIDCVTFYRLPEGQTDEATLEANPELFDLKKVKSNYQVDGFLTNLSLPADKLISLTCYWYGVWSHRRGGSWKGFIEVHLDPSENTVASKLLDSLNEEEKS